MRTECRIGELTAALPTSHPGRESGIKPNVGLNSIPKKAALRDAGLSSQDAARFEQMAAIPAATFEECIAETKAEAQRLTRDGLVKKAKRKQAESARAEQRIIQPLPPTIQLLCGDFREVQRELPDDSVDIILTDPPYPRAFLPLYGDLAAMGFSMRHPSIKN